MNDPFARIRARRRPQPAETETPLAAYAATYADRVWAMLLLLGWTPVMLALIVLMFLNERAIKDAFAWGTGLMVLCMLTLLASLVLVPMLAASRRAWTLYPDRLEIVQRPLVPLFGVYRQVALPLGEIAAARRGEALNGMPVFEIEGQGRRYRIAPKHLGQGRNVCLDNDGLETFINQIGAAIVAAGHPRPAGEHMDTPGSGLSGVVILSVITALLGALCLFGVWALFEGEPVAMQALALGVPLTLLFAGLLRSRWAKWRAGVG